MKVNSYLYGMRSFECVCRWGRCSNCTQNWVNFYAIENVKKFVLSTQESDFYLRHVCTNRRGFAMDYIK